MFPLKGVQLHLHICSFSFTRENKLPEILNLFLIWDQFPSIFHFELVKKFSYNTPVHSICVSEKNCPKDCYVPYIYLPQLNEATKLAPVIINGTRGLSTDFVL
jgi:hypothetical protein